MRNVTFSFFLVSWLAAFGILLNAAVEDEAGKSLNTIQEVDGLFFDVDEGVKVEKGSGGSVYIRSNREYMKNKFKSIDRRFQALEERLTELEILHQDTLGGITKHHLDTQKERGIGRVLTS